MKHKNQIFEENFYENCTKNQTQKTKFWRNFLRKTYFLKKKTFFNFCSIFVKTKKQ